MTSEVDILIVAALLEEWSAAKEVLSAGVDGMRVAAWSEAGDPLAPYLVGDLVRESGGTVRVALSRPTRMGATSTAPFTTKLAERLKPRCLAMTGVCAGNPSDVALGDVVVAELTYAYDEGKRTENGFEGDHRQYFALDSWVRAAQELDTTGLPSHGKATAEDADLWLLEMLYHGADPRKHPARPRYFPEGAWKPAVQLLEHKGLVTREGNTLAISDMGREEVNKALVYDLDPPRVLPFKIFAGPIASGNVVVKDGVTWDALKIMGVRTVIGLEMEGAAIGSVARSNGIPHWIVVKGVMDHADPKKDDRYKAFAARASAEVLVRLLGKVTSLPDFVDAAWLDRIKGCAAAARRDTGGHNFVMDPTPETLPPGLQREVGHAVLYREPVLDGLLALHRNPAPGQLALIKGPPRAGKSDAISLFALALTKLTSAQQRKIGMLHVELTLTTRPKRAVFRAVGGTTALPGWGGTFPLDGKYDDDDVAIDREAEYIQDIIPAIIQDRRLVTLFEGYSDIAERASDRAELEQLLGLAPFRRAFNVVETGLAILKPLHWVCVDLHQTALSFEHAVNFIGCCFSLEAIAREAIRHVITLGGAEALLPGILHDGALVYTSRLAATSAEPDPETLALTVLTQALEVAEALIPQLVSESEGVGEPREALLVLMGMAVFEGTPISAEQRDALALPAIPIRGLLRIGWLNQLAEGDQLTGFGRDALRAAAQLTLEGSKRPLEVGAREFLRMLDKLATALFNERDGKRLEALERAVGWLNRILPEDAALLLKLKALLNLESVFDPVPPFSAEDDRILASQFQALGAKGDLDFAVAALAGHAREASGPPRRRREEVYDDYCAGLQIIAALIEGGSLLNSRNFFSLNTAVYVGARGLNAFSEAHDFYDRIVKLLAGQEQLAFDHGYGAWLAAWASLLLNAADSSISHDTAEAARDLIERASKIIEPDEVLVDNARKQWLRSRAALLRERLADNPMERHAALAKATECAALALGHFPDDPRGMRYFLRTVRRQVDAEGDEAQRQAHADAARRTIEAIHGSPEHWDIATRAQFAALMRQEARRSWSMRYQQERANEALELLRKPDGSGEEEIALNPQACVVKARLQAFLGQHEAALESCNHSLRQAPGPAAWRLKFRLLDGPGGGAEDWSDRPAAEGRIPPQLRKAIREFRDWAKAEEWKSPGVGRVELWSWQREWRAQGSLERWIAQEREREGVKSYFLLSRAEKLQKLKLLYQRRLRVIDGIKERYGEFIDVVLARFDLEAQYRRSVSIISRSQPNVGATFRVVNDALATRWRNNHLLRFHKADYQRYIWDFDGAIAGFRGVISASVDGDLRRRATVALVRTLHTVAVYSEDLGQELRYAASIEARNLSENLMGAFEDAPDIAILRDHIAFELGESVDWTNLDNVYSRVVGHINGFPSTLFSEYEALRRQPIEPPRNTAEVLRTNFADHEVLGLAGMLYLRRAEAGAGNDLQGDFVRAAGLFLSESVIERTWEGEERAVTAFRIARTIISAAEAFRTTDPIPNLPILGKPNQLVLANSLLKSGIIRTTGRFKIILRRWLEQGERAAIELQAGSA